MVRRKSAAKQEEEFIQGVMGLTGFGVNAETPVDILSRYKPYNI